MRDPETDARIDPAVLEAWPALPPPANFAARALAAAERRGAPPRAAGRRLRAGAIAVAIAAAAAIAFLLLRKDGGGASAGTRISETRESIALGPRGTAVVEAATELRWDIDGDRAHIEQSRGSVFYRVDPGGTFTVRTPAGSIEVEGTCFRVEVEPMSGWRDRVIGAAAGAAVGITAVSVLEGKVLVGNEKGKVQLEAGQSAQIVAGQAPRATDPTTTSASALRSGPPPDASPEQLRGRDQAQREEIARLEEKVRALQTRAGAASSGAPAAAPPKEKFFDFTKEELAQMAARCELRYDVPAYALELDPRPLPADKARELGLTEKEREALNRILAEGDDELVAALRALYVEATGDSVGARTLSPRNLQHEVFSKSTPDQMAEALQQLARERAGLAEAPDDREARTPVERLLRLLQTSGDRLEAELARTTGVERAHELRKKGVGFGRRAQAQCPGETE